MKETIKWVFVLKEDKGHRKERKTKVNKRYKRFLSCEVLTGSDKVAHA